MLDRDGRLKILGRFFEVNKSLPKFKNKKEKGKANFVMSVNELSDSTKKNVDEDYVFSTVSFPQFWSDSNGRMRVVNSASELDRVNVLVRILRWFGIYKPKYIKIQDFFKSVKNNTKELMFVNERTSGLSKLIQQASKNGQMALMEQLASNLCTYKLEIQMLSMGVHKYVTEETIVTFYKMCKKGLRFDWVKNYTRQIPETVLAVKQRADELEIFDNYAILHYDPDATAYSKTNEERRDPILFGVLRDSTKLYFIGDWIDEYCDLTLEQLADLVGKEKIHNIEIPESFKETS